MSSSGGILLYWRVNFFISLSFLEKVSSRAKRLQFTTVDSYPSSLNSHNGIFSTPKLLQSPIRQTSLCPSLYTFLEQTTLSQRIIILSNATARHSFGGCSQTSLALCMLFMATLSSSIFTWQMQQYVFRSFIGFTKNGFKYSKLPCPTWIPGYVSLNLRKKTLCHYTWTKVNQMS